MRLSFVSMIDLKNEQASLDKAVNKLNRQVKALLNKQKRMEKDFDGFRGGRTKRHYKHYDSTTKRIVICEEYSFATSRKFQKEMDGMHSVRSALISERNSLQYQLIKINEIIKAREPVVRR